MIKVTIYKTDKHEYVGFDALGHAGFADEGMDIVCAAASALIINTINAVERYTSDETSVVTDDSEGAQGLIQFRFTGGRPTHDAELLLKTMILGLEEIEDDSDYEPYIDIIFKEV
ncbi:ribosomal-processing cysteine protease Prp [Muricomes sp. OA1]|uniref:Ribosomal processing cysteine protease Prp n=1 Tax=Hungatella hathewayi TaxID=154046 RepID=A0A3E2WWJ6_9FIRM|nr:MULTISPECIES: ribosomal-processing cysteine protease Prp [Clostridia]MCH1974076.1 ribosomal-processing cysteine protease Prp [Muricomes sp. OA1]RGC32327.1 ribosomal-processing cysteine protease Prp [Hungatella hathewayi]GKH32855.1 cysteine protease [Faecalicatena contorta]